MTDAEIERAVKVSPIINELDVKRSGEQQLCMTLTASEDIVTAESSDKISMVFANWSADGEILHKAAYEPAKAQDTVAENVAEQCPQEQPNVVFDVLKESDVESKGNF